MLYSCLLMLPLVLEPEPTEVKVVRYRGELFRKDSDGFNPIDDFQLLRFVSEKNQSVGFFLLQSGTDRAPWTSAFGTSASPAVRHVHEGVPYQLKFVALSIDRDLNDGATWGEGRSQFRVGERKQVGDRDGVEVFVQEGAARNHKLVVDTETRHVLSLTQRVFMGRGDEFRLTLTADTTRAEQLNDDIRFLNQLQKLRESAGLNGEKRRLSQQQLTLVSSALPDLKKVAKSRWASRAVSQIERETKSLANQIQRVADLEQRMLGQPLPQISGSAVDGTKFDSRALAGNITVLHIWQYRDEPLTEPYGQTAYLDFLSNKFTKKPVRVVGINIDSRFADKTLSRKANRSTRKLVEFMNLSYPVVGNDGSLLRQVGDPRSAAATLPLWIVADKSGRVRLWKSGYFKVDSRRGLDALEKKINELLRP